MKTYRYKNNNGNWISSIYPKPSKNVGITANGIISLIILIGMIIFLIQSR